jgi:hypothetical protein
MLLYFFGRKDAPENPSEANENVFLGGKIFGA